NQFITKSAQTTYNLFKRGYDIQQIAHIRQLKENTICDHFVEISLFDTSFPVEDYVDEEAQREIVRASQKLQTPKLKEIKQVVSEHITYFQIRLVLAQLNMTQGEDHGKTDPTRRSFAKTFRLQFFSDRTKRNHYRRIEWKRCLRRFTDGIWKVVVLSIT